MIEDKSLEAIKPDEAAEPDKLHLRGDNKNDDGEVAIKLR
jgi:hypothetical protein